MSAGLLMLAQLSACSAPLDAACRAANAQPAMRAELLFGLSRTGAPPVTAAEFQAFVAAHVTQRFPRGHTVLDGDGHWQSDLGVATHEAAKLLLVVTEPDATALALLQAIRSEYKAGFHQDSVGLVLSPACSNFESR